MKNTKRAAVVLSGCGNRDGTEITEAVSTLIALSEAGAQIEIFAPDMDFKVGDHRTGQPTGETRNVLTESARIARGQIRPLSELRAGDFDCLAFPGGTGAALHLCGWFAEGSGCKVLPDAERVIREFYQQEKPIAAICIAPALIARVLGAEGITVTVGADQEAGAEVAKTGALIEICTADDFVTDREHRIVTSPAYMHASATPSQVFTGIRKAIRELVEMA